MNNPQQVCPKRHCPKDARCGFNLFPTPFKLSSEYHYQNKQKLTL